MVELIFLNCEIKSFQGEVWHYQIRRHGEDAFFSIDDQAPIHGLECLIENYQKTSNGLVTKLTEMVKSNPPPPESRRHGRNNLLHRATQQKHLDIVSELLQTRYASDSKNSKNEKGQTAVHLVCLLVGDKNLPENDKRIAEQILDKLISSGANVNCRDKEGNTPLHVSCLK